MVLMEWTDHSRRRFESWRISIFYRKWLQNTANQWLPCFWLSSFDRYSRHNSHYVACFSPIVTPFDSCIFFREALPKPRGQRGGEQGPLCAFHFPVFTVTEVSGPMFAPSATADEHRKFPPLLRKLDFRYLLTGLLTCSICQTKVTPMRKRS